LFFEIFLEKSGTDEFDHGPVRFSPFLLPKAHQVEAMSLLLFLTFFLLELELSISPIHADLEFLLTRTRQDN
jgi:hypothetical protein